MTAEEVASLERLTEPRAREHLERLMGSWGMIADLSFSDLLLYVPTNGSASLIARPRNRGDRRRAHDTNRFAIVGQMRPATSQTLFPSDRVGEVAAGDELIDEAWGTGKLAVEEGFGEADVGPLRREAVPVGFDGATIAVVVRVWSPRIGRRIGGLERVYRRISERLSSMVTAGVFPFHTVGAVVEYAPRVGDGVVVLNEAERISFASPNAVNALHRLGATSSIVGAQLEELGIRTQAVSDAFCERIPVIEEVERLPDVRVIFHCIPLIDDGSVVGAAVLLRDVTDLRLRDRLLLSKDAAMREVHHRVKNNLQTISSLLRLQSRRLGPGRAQDALEEAERRIRSIAVVHEALSREPGDRVSFSEIVPNLVELAQDAGAGTKRVAVDVLGEAGALEAEVATPLALVIAELLQNAAQHGRPLADRPLNVALSFSTDDDVLRVEVRDDGNGFPANFDLDRTRGLGLSIVRDLVRTQLRGSISVENNGGAVVRIAAPLAAPAAVAPVGP